MKDSAKVKSPPIHIQSRKKHQSSASGMYEVYKCVDWRDINIIGVLCKGCGDRSHGKILMIAILSVMLEFFIK